MTDNVNTWVEQLKNDYNVSDLICRRLGYLPNDPRYILLIDEWLAEASITDTFAPINYFIHWCKRPQNTKLINEKPATNQNKWGDTLAAATELIRKRNNPSSQ
jgi:hypothetical protein